MYRIPRSLRFALLAVLLLAAAPLVHADCYSDCADQFDLCDLYCDPYGGPNGCDSCYQEFDECRDFCDVCPIVSETTDPPVPVSYTSLGVTHCWYNNVDYPFSPFPKVLFEEYDVRYVEVTKRVTQNCDGTITTEIIDQEYFNALCFRNTHSSCFIATNYASNYCTFN